MDRTYALQLLSHKVLLTRVLAFNAKRALRARAAALPSLVQHLTQQQNAGQVQNTEQAQNIEQSAEQRAEQPQLSAQARQLLQTLYVKAPNLRLFAEITHPQVPPFDFDNKYDRLQLLSNTELSNLALYLGVSRLSPALSHIVVKSELEQIYAVIPASVLNFALNYARFSLEPHLLVTTLPNELSQCAHHAVGLGADLLVTLAPHFSVADLGQMWQERLAPLRPDPEAAELTCSAERLFKLCSRILR